MNERSTYGDQVFKILIVGDDPENHDVLAKILKRHCSEVFFARDGSNGLEQAVNALPDLILVDEMMSDSDGFETCRRLKENEKTRDIPVILMMAVTEKKAVAKGLNSGAVDFITKPFLNEEIVGRIGTQLLLIRAEKQLTSNNIRFEQETEKRRQAEKELKKHIDMLKELKLFLKRELALNKALDNTFKSLMKPDNSVADIAKTVLEKAKDLTLSRHGYVSEIDPDTGDNVIHTLSEMIKTTWKLHKAEDRRIRFPRGEDGFYPCLWGHCLNTHKPFYTNSTGSHPSSKGSPQGHIAIERFLSIPVMLADNPVGQIALANKREDYTDEDLFAICRLAELYALAVQRNQWEKALRVSEQSKLKEAERSRRALLSILEDQKLAGEKIKASLQEKEILLREIHHRVKNNLQIVSSLLQLQASYATDDQTIRLFNESQLQIRTMALVHEKLYQTENMSMVDLGDYTKSIAENLFQFYTNAQERIRLTLEIDNIFLSIDKAIPCGMIINELLINSLEHGFPGDLGGEIGIRLGRGELNGLELTVYDTGKGIPDNVDFRHTETLGLHLVTILTEDQLQGKIELDKAEGTKFRIQFK